MGYLNSFLNANSMNNDKIVELAVYIVNTECQNEIKNVVNGMLNQQEFHDAVKKGMDPNEYINFLREFTNQLDVADNALQSKTSYFANSFANDFRIKKRSHPIIKLYELLIDINTCCKNYCVCEYDVIKAIYSAKNEAVAEQKVLNIRSDSNYYFNESDKRMRILMDIIEDPRKVLSI